MKIDDQQSQLSPSKEEEERLKELQEILKRKTTSAIGKMSNARRQNDEN